MGTLRQSLHTKLAASSTLVCIVIAMAAGCRAKTTKEGCYNFSVHFNYQWGTLSEEGFGLAESASDGDGALRQLNLTGRM